MLGDQNRICDAMPENIADSSDMAPVMRGFANRPQNNKAFPAISFFLFGQHQIQIIAYGLRF
jgi:hypothetical protein